MLSIARVHEKLDQFPWSNNQRVLLLLSDTTPTFALRRRSRNRTHRTVIDILNMVENVLWSR